MARAQEDIRRRRLQPAARRAQILDAAVEVFRRREPSAVRFDEVAAAAGVSRSLVYAYFGDRGGLMAAVYLHTLSDFDVELSDLLADVPVDEHRLGALVRSYLRLVDANADTWRLFAAAGTLDHAEVQQARRVRTQRIADTWGGDVEARLVARGLIGLLEASATEWLEQRACTVERAGALLSHALWHGIARLPLATRPGDRPGRADRSDRPDRSGSPGGGAGDRRNKAKLEEPA
ncbi:MAG TPA: helix-turn-helix domain-containing protein [Acidimicrobiales bacterium]|nr:helix-turn-helix domain-containing protein [Acidimicrobiales bacterium]